MIGDGFKAGCWVAIGDDPNIDAPVDLPGKLFSKKKAYVVKESLCSKNKAYVVKARLI